MTDEERAYLVEEYGEEVANQPYYPAGPELDKVISVEYFGHREGHYSTDLNEAWPLLQYFADRGGEAYVDWDGHNGIMAEGKLNGKEYFALGENPAHAVCIMFLRARGHKIRDAMQIADGEDGEFHSRWNKPPLFDFGPWHEVVDGTT